MGDIAENFRSDPPGSIAWHNPYTEGRTAAQNGAARSDNPYLNEGVVKREEWDEGWKTGRMESAFKERDRVLGTNYERTMRDGYGWGE